ncbi:MAG TPA: response regulator transcription factor [Candidatus Paceibacterota bacterium]|nr:response regulator transcription factor [Verrucomicrobiota bacterium]HSA10483.1 response regulator transcription factor [Candidatus Paceibacterota bacterium]
MPIRIAIVDDDDGVRTKLARAVDEFGVCSCVGTFSSGEDAVVSLAATAAEVVLMDINVPGMSGIECVRRLKAANPGIEFIMLTVYEDTESVFNALAAGASGYLLKLATRQELLDAIQQVRHGGSPMTSHIARKVVQSFRRPAPLETDTSKPSAREQQVLELLTQGFLYKEISQSLGISYDTVHNHIRHIYDKLHVRSRTQAVMRYRDSASLSANSIRWRSG